MTALAHTMACHKITSLAHTQIHGALLRLSLCTLRARYFVVLLAFVAPDFTRGQVYSGTARRFDVTTSLTLIRNLSRDLSASRYNVNAALALTLPGNHVAVRPHTVGRTAEILDSGRANP